MRKVTVAFCAVVLAAFAWAEDRVSSDAEQAASEVVAPKEEPVKISSSDTADDMSWWTVDSGGGVSSGGSFSLEGTIGQPESGVSSHCGYVLSGGHWSGTEDFEHLFCDGFESGDFSFWSSIAGKSR